MPDHEQPGDWSGEDAGAGTRGVETAPGGRLVGLERAPRAMGTEARPWGPRRGFGCLFALLFLFVAGSLVAGSAYILSHLGRFPGFVAIVLVVLALAVIARTVGRTARTLDRLVEATHRVATGDYSVRVTRRCSWPSVGAGAGRGFRHDGGSARDRRTPASQPPRRRQPRAPKPDGGHPGQSRGDRRRHLPGRREHISGRSSTKRGSLRGSSTTCGRSPCPRPGRWPSTASQRIPRS